MMQAYGLSGRKMKPDYVGAINAGSRLLPQKKEIEDTEEYRNRALALDEDYRNRTLAFDAESQAKNLANEEDYQNKNLALQEATQTKNLASSEADRDRNFALEVERMANEERFARDTLRANKKDAENANLIGLGQLGISAYQGRARDTALKEVLTGGGETGKVTGSVMPTISGDRAATPTGPVTETTFGLGGRTVPAHEVPAPASQDMYDAQVNSGSPISETDWGDGVWEGIKGGAKNWGDIGAGSLVGATLGKSLGEKYIGNNDTGRAIGGAVTSGALSYLSSGNLYTSAISSIFGGLGALL